MYENGEQGEDSRGKLSVRDRFFFKMKVVNVEKIETKARTRICR